MEMAFSPGTSFSCDSDEPSHDLLVWLGTKGRGNMFCQINPLGNRNATVCVRLAKCSFFIKCIAAWISSKETVKGHEMAHRKQNILLFKAIYLKYFPNSLFFNREKFLNKI